MVFSSATSRATSSIKPWAHFSPAQGAECVKVPQLRENCTGWALVGRFPLLWPCPALFQRHIACGYCLCNSPASSTAPGYELIRPRQGSKSTRIEGRGKGCYSNPKAPWERRPCSKIIFTNVSLIVKCQTPCWLSLGVSVFE